MSVYNGADHLEKSIDSVLNQTFTDFEFIIIDDGSTDKTPHLLENYSRQDKRIRVITQNNLGLTQSLNRGIRIAKGKYIARQDADDVSLPNRLEKQVNLMEKRDDVVLCGANCINILPNGFKTTWGWENENTLKKTIFYKTPFAHSTAFIRKTTLDHVGGYNENYATSQDAELWMHLSKYGIVAMIEEPLLERYILDSSISKRKALQQFRDSYIARVRYSSGLINYIRLTHYSLRSFFIGLLPDPVLKKLLKIRNKLHEMYNSLLEK